MYNNPTGGIIRYMLFENVITYNGMTASNGMTVSNPTDVTVGTTGPGYTGATGSTLTFGSTGTYNIQISAQVYKTIGGTDINIWPINNGQSIPWSNNQVTITSNNIGLFYANSSNTYNFNKDDKLQIGWESAEPLLSLKYVGATGNVPATPSVKLNATKISN
jgi:hypothetical protein